MRRVYKKNRQERTSKLQHTVFLDFLEDNPDFDPRQHLAKRHMQKWRNVVMSLNKVGPSRNVDVWVYILHSWRNQIKSKAKKIGFDPMCGLALTNIEQRALEIFQRDSLNISVSPSCNSSVNLDSEGIASMLDVQIKQELDGEGEVEGEEYCEEDETSDIADSLPNEKEPNLLIERIEKHEEPPKIERPSITCRPTARLMRPERIVQIPEVSYTTIRTHPVRITKVHSVPPNVQPAISTESIQPPPAPVSEPMPLNALVGLAQTIQQSVDKYVETNRIYNRHRMEMDRQNAQSMAVIASSLKTFTQAILNFSQQPNNRF